MAVIFQNTDLLNDNKYVHLEADDNKYVSNWQIDNLRTYKYTKNPNYYFPVHHKLYDLQNIDEGKGPGQNPDVDSQLTRGNVVNLPEDRLQEKVTFVRYIDFLPNKTIPLTKNNKFLMSTSISVDPQKNYNPEFNICGVNTKHFNRLSDEHYRKIVNKSNKYRLCSKIQKLY